MIIIIGNQKGGAGKSTLAMLLANYLTQVRLRKVLVIDMDYQQSVSQSYLRTALLENDPPYEVMAASLEQYPLMLPLLTGNKQQIVIIDLPGKLDDDGLIPVFQTADLVLCPFTYEAFSFDSTVLFSVVLRKINPDASITFIPCRIKGNVLYELKKQVDAKLSKLGKLTAVIPDRIDFQRTNTMRTHANVQPLVLPVFEQIWTEEISVRSVVDTSSLTQ
ncbi:MAG: ParA family protein [Pedobacter sp.]|nr:MAG: ParA family protein [Pedobacter sp.]